MIRTFALILSLTSAVAVNANEAPKDTPPTGSDTYVLSVDQADSLISQAMALNPVDKQDKNGAPYKARMKFGSGQDKTADVHWNLGAMVDALKPFLAQANRAETQELDDTQVDRAQSNVDQADAGCPGAGDNATKVSVECAKARLKGIQIAAQHAKNVRKIHCHTATFHLVPPTKEDLNLEENNLTPVEVSAFVMMSKPKSEIEASARLACSDIKDSN